MINYFHVYKLATVWGLVQVKTISKAHIDSKKLSLNRSMTFSSDVLARQRGAAVDVILVIEAGSVKFTTPVSLKHLLERNDSTTQSTLHYNWSIIYTIISIENNQTNKIKRVTMYRYTCMIVIKKSTPLRPLVCVIETNSKCQFDFFSGGKMT